MNQTRRPSSFVVRDELVRAYFSSRGTAFLPPFSIVPLRANSLVIFPESSKRSPSLFMRQARRNAKKPRRAEMKRTAISRRYLALCKLESTFHLSNRYMEGGGREQRGGKGGDPRSRSRVPPEEDRETRPLPREMHPLEIGIPHAS